MAMALNQRAMIAGGLLAVLILGITFHQFQPNASQRVQATFKYKGYSDGELTNIRNSTLGVSLAAHQGLSG
jgi:hypothetical protein